VVLYLPLSPCTAGSWEFCVPVIQAEQRQYSQLTILCAVRVEFFLHASRSVVALVQAYS
jgi:hypothetical protein